MTYTSQKSQGDDRLSGRNSQHVAQHILCRLKEYQTIRMGFETR